MKKCQCKKCGQMIDLTNRYNIRFFVAECGYKFYHEHYYAKCPNCSERNDLKFKDLPFKIRWMIFRGII